jgi:hypothetical protein
MRPSLVIVELAAFERCHVCRIGEFALDRRIGQTRELRQKLSASFFHQPIELIVVIREEQEWR